MDIHSFRTLVWSHYQKHKRDLPWRKTTDPYRILVSEVMLQQTQVSRILVKYPQFIETFPDFNALAQAPLSKVLKVWQGIGYNRRALFLKKTAKIVVDKYQGKLPGNPVELETLPGIGRATAGSIAVYAFNKPVLFIETNVRRVFIHSFFEDTDVVDDKDIEPFVRRTMDMENPREWYYAIMDYGAYLARTIENPNRKSKHYTIQPRFEGSARQLRGKVLRLLLKKNYKLEDLKNIILDDRLEMIVKQLEREGLIGKVRGCYRVK